MDAFYTRNNGLKQSSTDSAYLDVHRVQPWQDYELQCQHVTVRLDATHRFDDNNIEQDVSSRGSNTGRDFSPVGGRFLLPRVEAYRLLLSDFRSKQTLGARAHAPTRMLVRRQARFGGRYDYRITGLS